MLSGEPRTTATPFSPQVRTLPLGRQGMGFRLAPALREVCTVAQAHLPRAIQGEEVKLCGVAPAAAGGWRSNRRLGSSAPSLCVLRAREE